MYKKLLIVGLFALGVSPAFSQTSQSTINKCDNGKGSIIYTEFDCPEGYEIVTEGWLSETNMTSAEKFGDESKLEENRHNNQRSSSSQILE